jgi:heme/copper-type cytochrome/quinol oxidase subunit 1
LNFITDIHKIYFLFKNFYSFPISANVIYNQKTFNQGRKKILNNLSKLNFLTLAWVKVRIIYYINNWVYTTNHKRIAVNYFWFVILSGIFGMVLATVIRLELAYPGVGIFAGDSLQYLSLVTAHGVIMVFFMIMPLIFGAFANFLLPTQLGVHDVAFPRLNSAAFWFLPAGLIMLGQLICIDRRYQRMNCFNIREVQSILKRKFFIDLINSNDHHNINNRTITGTRFKAFDLTTLDSNIFISYNYGLELNSKFRLISYFDRSTNTATISFFQAQLLFKLIKLVPFSPYTTVFNGILLSFGDNIFFINYFFFVFKNTYVKINWIFEQIVTSNVSGLYKSFSTLLDSIFTNLQNLFSTRTTFSVKNLFTGGVTLLQDNLFVSVQVNLISFNSSYFTIKQWIIFLLKNLTITFDFKDFFFLFRFIEYLNIFSYFDINEFIYYRNYFFFLQLIYTTTFNIRLNVFHFTSFFLDWSFFTKIWYASNYAEFASNRNNFTKNYWLNAVFYQSELDETTTLPVNRWNTANFNSYDVYSYILLNIWYNVPYFFSELISGLFNFKNLVVVSNNFYNFIINWYIPLIFPSNILETFVYLKSSSFFKAPNFKILTYRLHSIVCNLFEYFYNTLYNYNIFFNLSKLYATLNIFICNIFFFTYKTLNELGNLNATIVFGNKNFHPFEIMSKLIYNNLNLQIEQNRSVNFFYNSNYFNNFNSAYQFKNINQETSNSYRYLRFSYPVFKYDYKSGDYFPKLYKEAYAYLFTTMADLTSAVRTAPWFLSNQYFDVFLINFNNFILNASKENFVNNHKIHSWNNTNFPLTGGFYNFFYILESIPFDSNNRWVSLSSLNQKFYHMFHGSSMQQRIYSNWRQLKFTREAWRCKLLTARHQKTMYKRYVHEDGVFWSIERNAKDLLPGWAMITPFSSRTRFTAIGKTDIGLMAVLLVLNSSIVSAANFLVTYRYLSTLNNRKMRDARSFFTEGVMVASWMMVAANPMLVIGIVMLLSDRHWQTSFFDYSGGGDTVLFQHMFWFFGHPEVYIIIIPVFGFTNTFLSHFLKKRISARASLMYSMYTIAFLGFFVWGHHMYMVGLAHTTRMLFSTLTVMISVPAATKLMHWCVTIANSAFTLELPMLCTLTFIFLFVSGGISGMAVAHTGMDILFHDTFYVIGHFHVLFAGAVMFGSFGAFYFYFPAIFGVKYSRLYAYLHYIYYLLGQLMTVIPMFWLGYAGMPRRVLDYPASMGGWHSIISAGHMLSVAGLIAFFIMIFDSLRQAKAATRNTFGISRYSIRLNFYLYEGARLIFVQRKGLYLYRLLRSSSIKLNKSFCKNLEPFETTLLSYTFRRR